MFPSGTMRWIKDIEMATVADDLETSQSMFGYNSQTSRCLRQRLLPLYFKERINLEEQKAQLDNRFFRARQIALMIPRIFSVKVTHAAILDYSVLFSMSSLGHDVQGIDTRWDFFFLLSIQKVPSNDILESLYKIRMRGSQVRTIC